MRFALATIGLFLTAAAPAAELVPFGVPDEDVVVSMPASPRRSEAQATLLGEPVQRVGWTAIDDGVAYTVSVTPIPSGQLDRYDPLQVLTRARIDLATSFGGEAGDWTRADLDAHTGTQFTLRSPDPRDPGVAPLSVQARAVVANSRLVVLTVVHVAASPPASADAFLRSLHVGDGWVLRPPIPDEPRFAQARRLEQIYRALSFIAELYFGKPGISNGPALLAARLPKDLRDLRGMVPSAEEADFHETLVAWASLLERELPAWQLRVAAAADPSRAEEAARLEGKAEVGRALEQLLRRRIEEARLQYERRTGHSF